MLVVVLGVVSAGALLSAVAPNAIVLGFGQALQGAGLGLFPLSVGIIRDTMPQGRAKSANGFFMASATLSSAAGLLVAGPITDRLPYQSIFWIMCAILLTAAVTALAIVPKCPPRGIGRLDLGGAALLAVALVASMFALTKSSTWGLLSVKTLPLILVALVAVALIPRAEKRATDPLIHVDLLKLRAVWITCLITFVTSFAGYACTFLIALFVSAPRASGFGFGADATATGFYLLPLGLSAAIVAPLTGRLEKAVGPRDTMLGGTVLIVLGSWILAALRTEPWHIVVALTLIGIGTGFVLTQTLNNVVDVVPAGNVAGVVGIMFVAKAIGGGFGAQIVAEILASQADSVTGLTTNSGFTVAFSIAAVVVTLAVPAALALPRILRTSQDALSSTGESERTDATA